jgi:hypothetical protein
VYFRENFVIAVETFHDSFLPDALLSLLTYHRDIPTSDLFPGDQVYRTEFFMIFLGSPTNNMAEPALH